MAAHPLGADGATAGLKACFVEAALQAGAVIMEVFGEEDAHRLKADSSPVTVADERAETIICRALESTFPDVPIVAEERASRGRLPAKLGRFFFLVDPLDGTREFINRRPDFTVNIALIVDGSPHAGVILAPATGRLYYGDAEQGAFGQSVDTATWKPEGEPVRLQTREACQPLVAVASRSHQTPETVAWLDEKGITEYVSVGSSLKFCLLAEGKADLYPRFGRTMEWDTAAGDAILRAAGGMTVNTDGTPFQYGKRGQSDDVDFANPFFVARAR